MKKEIVFLVSGDPGERPTVQAVSCLVPDSKEKMTAAEIGAAGAKKQIRLPVEVEMRYASMEHTLRFSISEEQLTELLDIK